MRTRVSPPRDPATGGPSPCPPSRAEYLAQAAEFLAVSTKQLETWRRIGGDDKPRFHKFASRLVRYAVADLRAWAAGHRVSNTAEGHELLAGKAVARVA